MSAQAETKQSKKGPAPAPSKQAPTRYGGQASTDASGSDQQRRTLAEQCEQAPWSTGAGGCGTDLLGACSSQRAAALRIRLSALFDCVCGCRIPPARALACCSTAALCCCGRCCYCCFYPAATALLLHCWCCDWAVRGCLLVSAASALRLCGSRSSGSVLRSR